MPEDKPELEALLEQARKAGEERLTQMKTLSGETEKLALMAMVASLVFLLIEDEGCSCRCRR